MSTTSQLTVHQPLTAEEVRAFRQSLGLTQVQFAAKLDVSRRAIEVWESASPSRPPHYLRFAFAAIVAGLEPWAPGTSEAPKEITPEPKPAKAQRAKKAAKEIAPKPEMKLEPKGRLVGFTPSGEPIYR
jgi:transcriptional regulator with XRE-family HTH domain